MTGNPDRYWLLRRAVSRREFGLLALTGLVAACSGVPKSGNVVDDRSVSQAAPNTVTPNYGEPVELVGGFLTAAAGVSLDNTTGTAVQSARLFLTTDAAEAWPTTAKSIVLIDTLRVGSKGDATDVQQRTVNVSGTVAGTIDTLGVLTPAASSATGDRQQYDKDITVVKVGAQWRISTPPDNEIVVGTDDLDRLYQRAYVYFLDSTQSVVVPDPRWIFRSAAGAESLPAPTTVASTGGSGLPAAAGSADRRVRRLLDLLFGGPAGSLAKPGVATNLLKGATLRSNPLLIDQVTTVDLTNVKPANAAARRALAAQIAFTLLGGNLAQNVSVTIDAQSLEADIGTLHQPYTLSNLSAFDPDRTPGTGGTAQTANDVYYVAAPTDVGGPLIKTISGTPALLQPADRNLDVASAALSAATGVLAVVSNTGPLTQTLSLAAARNVALNRVLKGQNLTTPSFSRAGDQVWLVNNDASNRPSLYQVAAAFPPGGTLPSGGASPTYLAVSVPQFEQLKSITAFVVSPDGVRVALVADKRLYLGVLSYVTDENSGADQTTTTTSGDPVGTPSGGTSAGRPTVIDLALLESSFPSVGAVAFLNASYLIVAGQRSDPGYANSLQQISIDGWRPQTKGTSGIQNDDIISMAISTDGQTAYVGTNNEVIYQIDISGTSGVFTQVDTDNGPIVGTNPFLAN